MTVVVIFGLAVMMTMVSNHSASVRIAYSSLLTLMLLESQIVAQHVNLDVESNFSVRIRDSKPMCSSMGINELHRADADLEACAT